MSADGEVDEQFRRGFAMAGRPTIGAIRRWQSYTVPGDHGAELRRRLAVEVLDLQRAPARGADLRELHRRAAICVAIAEGHRLGALAESRRGRAA